MKRGVAWVIVLSLLGLAGLYSAHAATFNSTNFSINGNLGDSAAGGQTSTNYRLTSAGGESIVGNGSGGSYKLAQGYVSTLDNSLQLSTQLSGLVVYYSFDSPFLKTLFDEGPNLMDATIAGSPTQISGKVGNAISTSDNNSAQTTNTAALNNNTFTVEAWLKANDWTTSINGTAVGRWLGVNGDWQIGSSGSNQFRFVLYNNGTTYPVYSASGKSANQWYHVMATYDGTTEKLYVNGVLEASSATGAGAMPSTTTPLSVGERANQASPEWYGGIDEVKVFNRVLGASEVKAEYDAQNAGVYTGISLNQVTPGISQTAPFDSIIQTSSPGYTLAINQNNNLTNGAYTIPAVSGSIASPVTWSEGSTKGLGFTLYGTNATSIPGKWGTGNAYAALPGSSTAFYTRTGYNGGAKDLLNMRLRLDTTSSQVSGDYVNQMTITGTMTP